MPLGVSVLLHFQVQFPRASVTNDQKRTVDTLAGLKAESPKPSCQPGHTPSEASSGGFLPPLPASDDPPCSLSCDSNILISASDLVTFPVSLPSCIRALVIADEEPILLYQVCHLVIIHLTQILGEEIIFKMPHTVAGTEQLGNKWVPSLPLGTRQYYCKGNM